MKKTLLLGGIFLFTCYLTCFSQGESFTTKQVLNQTPALPADRYYLQHPFEILYGPDDSLWISERRGRVIKVDPLTGRKRNILNIPGSVKFTTAGGPPVTSVSQDGMMGLALHPDYPIVDSFFIAYTYDAGGGVRKIRIARYRCKNTTITTPTGNETVIIQNIPASVDHSSGRLMVGPDRKLYYSAGDQGANQFALRCNPVRAQDVPTAGELSAGNYIAYQGKVLRINLDGTIPSDNPTIKSIQSHIYTFGHRNPNSLVFAKSGMNTYAGAKLYSAENGPAEDDEINQLVSGKNYGWPYISGYRDDKIYKYKNWSSAANCASQPSPGSEPECSTPPAAARIMNETDTTLPNFQTPMRTFFTPTGSSIACSWLSNPTVAPSSMDYYGFANKIPGWYNSILMTTLKEGTVFRLKLSADGNSFVNMSNGSDTARYFREENRFRDIAIGRDGITFYLITDSVGQTSGPTTGNTSVLNNHGSILVYKYAGTLLTVNNDPVTTVNARIFIKMFPNPTSKTLYIESKRNVSKPIFYQVYDLTGRLMLHGTSNKDNFEVNVEGLSAGMYTVKLYNGQDINLLTEKVIIQ